MICKLLGLLKLNIKRNIIIICDINRYIIVQHLYIDI